MDERLEVKPDSSVRVGPMDPLDVVEPKLEHQPPSEGSRRCMIYRNGTGK